MHPIEHLRHLARTADVPAEWLVPEAAEALRGLADDRNALVLGSRKLLEHHPLCGPLWWLCGHLLTAANPETRADELAEEFATDPTPLQVSLALADTGDGHGAQPRIIAASMAAPSGIVVDEPTSPGETIWVCAGVGTVVPDEIFTKVTAGADTRVLTVDAVDRVIRPSGAGGSELLTRGPDVGLVPELLARG